MSLVINYKGILSTENFELLVLVLNTAEVKIVHRTSPRLQLNYFSESKCLFH